MDKMKLAHEWAIELLRSGDNSDDVISCAWRYADAMYAEAEKRNKYEAAQKRKEIREMLNAVNTFVEREGQHFDDVCSDEIQAQRDAELYGTGFLKVTYDADGVKYERLNPKTVAICDKNIGLDSRVLKEWQPDWSQAPSNATHWTMRQDGNCLWWKGKPLFDGSCFYDAVGICHTVGEAPSFDYQGDWRESLRERSQ